MRLLHPARLLRPPPRLASHEWVAYLAGFGALEVIVVYPAIAALYVLCAPRLASPAGNGGDQSRIFRPLTRVLPTLPLFIPAILFTILHFALIPKDGGVYYKLEFDSRIFSTLLQYFKWCLGPDRLFQLTSQWGRFGTRVMWITAFTLVDLRYRAALPPPMDRPLLLRMVPLADRSRPSAPVSRHRLLRLTRRARPRMAGRLGHGCRVAIRLAPARIRHSLSRRVAGRIHSRRRRLRPLVLPAFHPHGGALLRSSEHAPRPPPQCDHPQGRR